MGSGKRVESGGLWGIFYSPPEVSCDGAHLHARHQSRQSRETTSCCACEHTPAAEIQQNAMWVASSRNRARLLMAGCWPTVRTRMRLRELNRHFARPHATVPQAGRDKGDAGGVDSHSASEGVKRFQLESVARRYRLGTTRANERWPRRRGSSAAGGTVRTSFVLRELHRQC